MNNLLKRLVNSIIGNTPEAIEINEEPFRAHLCQRKEWKKGSSVVCNVCQGDAMDFMFSNRDAFERTQVLKEKQMDRHAS